MSLSALSGLPARLGLRRERDNPVSVVFRNSRLAARHVLAGNSYRHGKRRSIGPATYDVPVFDLNGEGFSVIYGLHSSIPPTLRIARAHKRHKGPNRTRSEAAPKSRILQQICSSPLNALTAFTRSAQNQAIPAYGINTGAGR